MTSPSPASSSSSSPDGSERYLAFFGWFSLGLLVTAVLLFGVDRHLGLFSRQDPQAAELALHRQLDRLARDLGLAMTADTRGSDLQRDPSRLAAVRRELDAILRRYPRSPRALYYQALERYAASDLPAARVAAAQALERDALSYQANLLLGTVHYEEKNYPEAEKAFRRAIEIAPQVLPAYDNLGQTLWLMGRFDEAKAVYRKRAEIEGLPLYPEAAPAPAAEAAPVRP